MATQPIDIGDYINRKRIQDAISTPQVDLPSQMPEQPDLTVHVKHFADNPNDTAPNGDTVVPPVASKTPYSDQYKRALESVRDYKEPSKVREVLGNITGVVGGILHPGSLEDRINSAGKIKNLVEHPRDEKATEQIAKYKPLADLEAQQAKQDLEQRKGESQIAEQGATTQLTQGQYRNLAPSYEQSVQDKLDEERARLAITEGKNREAELNDGSKIMIHQDPGGVMRRVNDDGSAGEVVHMDAIKDISDPNKSLKDTKAARIPGNLGASITARRIIAEGANGPNKYQDSDIEAAKAFVSGLESGDPANTAWKAAYAAAVKENGGKDLSSSQVANLNHLIGPQPQMLLVPAGGGQAQKITPGSNVAPNMQTPQQLGQENTETSTTRTMRETAPKVGELADKVAQEIDQNVKDLGPSAGRWADFWTGKVGAPNANFTKLRTDSMLLKTLLMRMHLGARGGQTMYEHFNDMLNIVGQDPENLKAAVGQIKDYANEVGKQPHSEGSSSNTLPGGVTIDDINAELKKRGK